MISFDSKDGRYEFSGTGDDIAKDYIGLTVALGRTMLEGGIPLPVTRSTLSTLAAQGITLIEMCDSKKQEPETGNKIVDFVKGDASDV